eukprot:s1561_g5.t1
MTIDTKQDPSKAFRAICQALEKRVDQSLRHQGETLHHSRKGRGQTSEVQMVSEYTTPPKMAREGEIQPEYQGPCMRHAQWIRQTRRIDNYHKLVRRPSDMQNLDHKCKLWHSIVRAPGFSPPDWPPAAEVASLILEHMKNQLRLFEKALSKARIQQAKQRRQDDPNIIFHDLRGPKPSPVQMLLEKRTATVIHVDQDESAIEVDPPQAWKGDEISVGNTLMKPIHLEPDKVWLPDVSQIQPDDQVSQNDHLGSLPDMFAAFAKEWSRRWDRHIGVDDSRWQPIIDFAKTALPQIPPMQYTKIEYPEWIQAVRKKPRKAATGPDALSRQDLLKMPRDLAEKLLQVLEQVELTGRWPRQLLDGFIVALEKQPDAQEVHQYRPISVFAVAYRTWSSIRATQILRHLSPYLPKTCTGNVPGRFAAQQWFGILEEIEQSATQGTALSGGVLDLVKAYNTLPRLPVLETLAHMGIPSPVLRAWTSALTSMSRRFRIRQAVGPPNFSSTGFAEGCALSCVGMLAINMICHQWCQVKYPGICCWSYVDNLEIVAESAELLDEGMSGLQAFCDLVDVTIDQKKTYTWALSTSERNQLRTKKHNLKLHDRDLGAHMSYSKLVTNYTVPKKCKKMGPLWNRLSRSLATYKNKVRSIKTKAWPSCLHAVASVHMADSHFGKLRTGAMQALGEHSRGTSPPVHLSLVESPQTDPQCFALLSTIMTYRMVGKGSTDFSNTMAHLHEPRQTVVPPPGPLSVLLTRLQQIAWSWQHSSVFHDQFGMPCDILQCSAQELTQRLTEAWQQRVQALASTRETMEGLQHTNAKLTTMDMHTHSPEDQATLKTCLNGTFFTADRLYEGKMKLPDQCKFCNQKDSQMHRHWLCPFFHDVRQLTQDQISQITQMPSCVGCHGWIPTPPALQPFRQHCILQPNMVDDHVWPTEVPETLHLFTDGSCLAPHCPFSRLSSWGVVLANLDNLTYQPIACGLTPGWLQSVLRAEILATISAVRFAIKTQRPFVLWVDNQLVFDRISRFAKSPVWVKPNQKHADLWTQLYDALQVAGVLFRAIHKVCSHQKPSQDDIEQWAIQGNAAADALAGRVFSLSSPTVRVWTELQEQLKQLGVFRKSLHNVLIQVGRKAMQTSHHMPAKPTPTRTPRIHFSQLQEVQIPALAGAQIAKTYTFREMETLHAWMGQLRDAAAEPTIISWFELNLLYEHQTQQKGVFYIKNAKQWINAHDQAEAEAASIKATNQAYCKQYKVTQDLQTSALSQLAKTSDWNDAQLLHYMRNSWHFMDAASSLFHSASEPKLSAARAKELLERITKPLGDLGDLKEISSELVEKALRRPASAPMSAEEQRRRCESLARPKAQPSRYRQRCKFRARLPAAMVAAQRASVVRLSRPRQQNRQVKVDDSLEEIMGLMPREPEKICSNWREDGTIEKRQDTAGDFSDGGWMFQVMKQNAQKHREERTRYTLRDPES